MLGRGYFLGSASSDGSSGNEDVAIDSNGNIVFTPVDPIHIDANGNVFYSQENKNAYMYSDSSGNVFVKAVN
ncbi:hypothetical protein CIL05_06865 [Virgibacillus profundi]|uniref:Uncharacterized protein n=1 Tax=Virgibacillus profundi TaxID=2024555 RepID=A0A2A2IGH0_9BACI|nr:hypothetical protein [Virgibacillus profundi]PAV30183.1 hypothetical protein CIL05_06865 [Virgibacillus profundi]PXY54355.1 hypothetical protein CIT14_06950 [Virgibacillus profundi]